jgi:hypothetical protein
VYQALPGWCLSWALGLIAVAIACIGGLFWASTLKGSDQDVAIGFYAGVSIFGFLGVFLGVVWFLTWVAAWASRRRFEAAERSTAQRPPPEN